jgi:hypothetical protein
LTYTIEYRDLVDERVVRRDQVQADGICEAANLAADGCPDHWFVGAITAELAEDVAA